MGKFKPVSYSESSTSSRVSLSSQGSSDGDYSREYSEAIYLIDTLRKNPNALVLDDPYSGYIERFKFMYLTAHSKEKKSIESYLKSNCQKVESTPGTVGSYLCGCFQSSSSYAGLEPSCTAGCADSIGADKCNETVILWTQDMAGNPQSKILSQGNGNCKVYVDPNFPILSHEMKQKILMSAQCTNATFYNSANNQPAYTNMQSTNQLAINQQSNQIQMPVRPPVVRPVIPQPEPATFGRWWIWLLLIFFLLVIIGIIVFLYMRN